MCGARNETILSECGKLAQKEYKQRHDSIGRYIHWQFCERLGFNRAKLWYEHEPESVVDNENFKILWDFTIQYNHMNEVKRPDITVVARVKKETKQGDTRVCDKEQENIRKYSFLKDEVARLWEMKKVVVIPIVVGALGTINTKFEK